MQVWCGSIGITPVHIGGGVGKSIVVVRGGEGGRARLCCAVLCWAGLGWAGLAAAASAVLFQRGFARRIAIVLETRYYL